MDYFAIGDIHGEFFKLSRLIQRLHIKKDDVLVFIGDYIDRGNMSFEVMDLLLEYQKKYNCVFLKGNHEEMFMDFLSGINERLFLHNGGYKTQDSYRSHGFDIELHTDYLDRHIPRSHITFFQKLKGYYETEEFIFVHAGISTRTPLENMPNEILLWDRGFSSIAYKGKVVVYGHTPNRKILNEKYKICIDTGACFESMGDLTAVKLPERTFIRQSWTLEDMDYEDGNGKADKKDGKNIFTFGPDLPKSSRRSWPT